MIDTDTYEIVQMINRNNHEIGETIQDINMLVSDIRNNPKELADKLESDKDSLAERTNRCTKCGEELIVNTYEENRGEYFGQPCREIVYEHKCENCGGEDN